LDTNSAYLWLSLGMLSNSKERALIEHSGSIQQLWCDFDKIPNSVFEKLKISNEKVEILKRFKNEDYLQNTQNNLYKKGIVLVDIESKKYPKSLKNISTPPIVLYALGDLDLLQQNCVAVVGTRHCSRYGQDVTKRIVKDLVDCNIVVVSGLATGIDTYAHSATLDNNGKTIAVLGSGFGFIGPNCNINLAKQITNCGLLLSEYAPNTEAQNYTFVQRNRIIAGISLGVVVVEAGLKSGATITANMALEQGKTVFAVPGNVTSPQSIGANNLIKEGAVFTTDGFMVANELKIAKKSVQNDKIAPIALDFFEQKVYTILLKGKNHFDDLLQELDCSVRELTVILSSMEIKQLIKKHPNNYYTLDA